MSKLTQKEAVFQAVSNVVGNQDGPYKPTREQRASVNQILFEGFRNGTVECDTEYSDSELKTYVSGLQSNWLRKDKRLNGNVKYEAKNPGSRTGSKDPQVQALRALMKTQTDSTKVAEIQSFINKRLSEIKPAKHIEIDVNALPAELQHLIK